jgi:hypothetical protein
MPGNGTAYRAALLPAAIAAASTISELLALRVFSEGKGRDRTPYGGHPILPQDLDHRVHLLSRNYEIAATSYQRVQALADPRLPA